MAGKSTITLILKVGLQGEVQTQGASEIRGEDEAEDQYFNSKSNGWPNEYKAIKITQFIRGWVNYQREEKVKQK